MSEIITVICNNCCFGGLEEDLIKVVCSDNDGNETFEKYSFQKLDEDVQEVINGCPNCFTDEFLTDTEYVVKSDEGFFHLEYGWVNSILDSTVFSGEEILEKNLLLPIGKNVKWALWGKVR